jgi:hypothetical protein
MSDKKSYVYTEYSNGARTQIEKFDNDDEAIVWAQAVLNNGKCMSGNLYRYDVIEKDPLKFICSVTK